MPLPREILEARLKNELAICQRCLRHPINIGEEAFEEYPITVEISLLQIPGYELVDGEIKRRYHHRFKLEIGEDYPFEKPYVTWRTPIFTARGKSASSSRTRTATGSRPTMPTRSTTRAARSTKRSCRIRR